MRQISIRGPRVKFHWSSYLMYLLDHFRHARHLGTRVVGVSGRNHLKWVSNGVCIASNPVVSGCFLVMIGRFSRWWECKGGVAVVFGVVGGCGGVLEGVFVGKKALLGCGLDLCRGVGGCGDVVGGEVWLSLNVLLGGV
jgi:hypothetical protein